MGPIQAERFFAQFSDLGVSSVHIKTSFNNHFARDCRIVKPIELMPAKGNIAQAELYFEKVRRYKSDNSQALEIASLIEGQIDGANIGNDEALINRVVYRFNLIEVLQRLQEDAEAYRYVHSFAKPQDPNLNLKNMGDAIDQYKNDLGLIYLEPLRINEDNKAQMYTLLLSDPGEISVNNILSLLTLPFLLTDDEQRRIYVQATIALSKNLKNMSRDEAVFNIWESYQTLLVLEDEKIRPNLPNAVTKNFYRARKQLQEQRDYLRMFFYSSQNNEDPNKGSLLAQVIEQLKGSLGDRTLEVLGLTDIHQFRINYSRLIDLAKDKSELGKQYSEVIALIKAFAENMKVQGNDPAFAEAIQRIEEQLVSLIQITVPTSETAKKKKIDLYLHFVKPT